jgi:arsenate reductase
MKLHPNEMVFCYHHDSAMSRQTLALARARCSHINELEYSKKMFTKTIWRDVLGMLQLRPKDLLNKANRQYQADIRGRDFDEEGWLDVLTENPGLIKAPIAIWRNKAVLCKQPSDILKL